MTRDDAWTTFDRTAAEAGATRIDQQFAADPDRLARMSVEAAGLYLDLSKQSWTKAGFEACLDLARACDVEGRRAALFAGEAVNLTEGRAVLHPALRAPAGADFKALGEPVSAEVDAVRADMKTYADAVRSGAEAGATGKKFEAIVHVGIGGSDLGPRVVWDALRPLDPAIDLRFVANIDPRDMAEALTGLDPETTLVVVVSKTFTTQETLANAEAAKAWLAAALPAEGMTKHFIGVTAAPDKAAAFGCGRTFAFRDWVGGRYSLWSAVSLSCGIALGWVVFEAMLAGAAAMDDHFVSAPLEQNAPILLALAQVFNVDGLNRPARTVAPYAHALRRLPSFLQQLEMESNGKRVHRDGTPVTRQTCPVVFGEPGTNGQHAFFQQIHQGPQIVPAEFVIVAKTHADAPESPLWSNALAQGQALMLGKTTEAAKAEGLAQGLSEEEAARLAPHRTFTGNRPSTAILMDRLTPQTLGALLALYEHKTFVEGVIWDINSFDQWGVELGKVLARAILKDVDAGGPSADLNPSTAALMTRLMG
ncbi:MAG: glucose-6-phosphate isomerase [Alphaproteobacteria bacterium]|uniref:glucose-6-phosphate isomerase n=1 Tax=Brevundimonas sp. TaxID=1871086 RepID=UPI0035661377|nr:glucose-6-phosphate isomerase [Alphaproteobacteria bacterium]MBU1522777.1 glucose-6-phosphate isomerase [Alphaproteobacteria bacterium]MBU2029871.1 glucose-6-phosphate isomerase [Alphaproteobacteria bacterium]MBU2164165.1 glucose-6-phosphate isomerase [Alphaproteobacteria bacterium]